MNLQEAADYAGVDVHTLYNAIQRKELKAYRYEMARIGTQVKGEPGYFWDIGALDIDKWLYKYAQDHQRPQRLITFVNQIVYDKFVTYCAKINRKCSWVISDLIVKELLSHGYKLQGYSKENKE